MRHTVVERLSLSALALAALSVIGFVLVVRPGVAPAPSPPVPDVFATHCESCHERVELSEQILGDETSLSPERRLELEKFLADHGDASAEEDRRILDELTTQPLSSGGASRRKER